MTSPQLEIPALTPGGSLAEQVRDALLQAIRTGALPPGTRLREIPLSEHFGLSKTPVREGLRLLEADGVVQVVPRRGAIVASLAPAAVQHLYDFRLILEVAAARAAATSDESGDRLRTLHRAMSRSLTEADPTPFLQLDLELHCEISRMGGNPELTEAIRRVQQRIQATRQRVAVTARLKVAHRQHGELIAAINAADPDRAEVCITEHITSACAHVMGELGA
ncbi:GntR family transcriptional regulator [Microlunatus sp. Y2014]|uniref:GntR family transcriptional regulator n=1 Tax=Microlunatus sp. Y2014 TaxID=3418488 RepID=UPI003DA79AF2